MLLCIIALIAPSQTSGMGPETAIPESTAGFAAALDHHPADLTHKAPAELDATEAAAITVGAEALAFFVLVSAIALAVWGAKVDAKTSATVAALPREGGGKTRLFVLALRLVLVAQAHAEQNYIPGSDVVDHSDIDLDMADRTRAAVHFAAFYGTTYEQLPLSLYESNIAAASTFFPVTHTVGVFSGFHAQDLRARVDTGLVVSDQPASNLRNYRSKLNLAFMFLKDEVDADSKVLLVRVDAHIHEARRKPDVDIQYVMNPGIGPWDGALWGSYDALVRTRLHVTESTIPENLIKDACGRSNTSCGTYPFMNVSIIKPNKSVLCDARSRGVRQFVTNSGDIRFPTTEDFVDALSSGVSHATKSNRTKSPDRQTKSKVAVCLSGELRTFSSTRASIAETLVRPFSADVFACTRGQQNTSTSKKDLGSLPNLKSVRNIPYRSSYPPVNCAFHKFQRLFPIAEGIACSFELMVNFERAWSFRYQWVIRARYDIQYAGQIHLSPHRWTSIVGLFYDRFPDGSMVKDQFYISPRYNAFASMRLDRSYARCDAFSSLYTRKVCSTLDRSDTECFLMRRVMSATNASATLLKDFAFSIVRGH